MLHRTRFVRDFRMKRIFNNSIYFKTTNIKYFYLLRYLLTENAFSVETADNKKLVILRLKVVEANRRIPVTAIDYCECLLLEKIRRELLCELRGA